MLCLPIGDKINSKGDSIDFYNIVFEENIPVSFVSTWAELRYLVPELLNKYPYNMHKVVCWWMKYKRDLGIKLMRQINE
jgi:hypothetical protein